jgi:hypothetical protein
MKKNATKQPKEKKPRVPKAARRIDVVMPCKHTFTQDERIAVGDDMTSGMNLYTTVEDEKKRLVKDYDNRLKEIEARVNTLKDKFRDGYEMRDTKVTVHFNTRTEKGKAVKCPGTKRIVRADNKVHVRDEPMTPSDMQAELFQQQQDNKKSDTPLVDKARSLPNEPMKTDPGWSAAAKATEAHFNTPQVPDGGGTASTAATA